MYALITSISSADVPKILLSHSILSISLFHSSAEPIVLSTILPLVYLSLTLFDTSKRVLSPSKDECSTFLPLTGTYKVIGCSAANFSVSTSIAP